MSHARAVVAGVMATVLAIDLLAEPSPTQDDVNLWLLLGVIVILLVIPDAVDQWKRRKEDH